MRWIAFYVTNKRWWAVTIGCSRGYPPNPTESPSHHRALLFDCNWKRSQALCRTSLRTPRSTQIYADLREIRVLDRVPEHSVRTLNRHTNEQQRSLFVVPTNNDVNIGVVSVGFRGYPLHRVPHTKHYRTGRLVRSGVVHIRSISLRVTPYCRARRSPYRGYATFASVRESFSPPR